MHGFMYILLCANGSYYVGSTRDLERRVAQHKRGEGANHTRKHGPVELVYFEWFPRVDHAFYREKQVQGWSRAKKQALINGTPGLLPELAKAYRDLMDLGLREPQPPVQLEGSLSLHQHHERPPYGGPPTECRHHGGEQGCGPREVKNVGDAHIPLVRRDPHRPGP